MNVDEVIKSLSAIEEKIFYQVISGKETKEIAQELGYCESHIRAHLTSIYKKTDSKSRLHLLAKFVDIRKNQHIVAMLYQTRSELDELKKVVANILPGGIRGNQIR